MTTLYRNFYTKYRELYGPDTCILLLVGKFYELYDYIDESGEPLTPIKRVSQIMSLTLKDKDGLGPKGEAGLWSGFPEQSLHKFAQTLTSQGWVVVVVDQVKDMANQVIDRIPTRILSPGTHIETAGQDRLSVAAIHLVAQSAKVAVAVNDLTTGEVFTFESEQDDDILHMLQVFCVKEIVCNVSESKDSIRSRFGIRGEVYFFPNHFQAGEDYAREEYFRKMFRVKGLLPVRTALNLDVSEGVESAMATLLRFVEDHFPKEAERLTSHTKYSPEGHMRLSNNILEQLNILSSNKSILSMLDRTYSSIGKRALRERILRPITSTEELERRWTQVEFAQGGDKNIVRDLKGLYDLPRLHFKLAGGSVSATDILQLFQTYSSTACLIDNLKDTPLECDASLVSKISEFRRAFAAAFDEAKASKRVAEESVGFLTDSAGPETAELEATVEECKTAWQTTLATFCKSVGVPLESFSIRTDSDGEYILEMWRSKTIEQKLSASKTFLNSKNLLPGLEIDSKKSGLVRVTCSDFYTFSQKLRSTVYKLNKSLAKESMIVCDSLWDSVKVFQTEWASWLGRVDCSFALASSATTYGWCKPRMSDSLDIQGLRHPLLEAQQTRANYVSHDVSLGTQNGWLIYGVNASGKSSLMKATGIAVILAQAGSFVPASSMRIRPYDAAFSRIWNQDNIWAGLSSFAVEVKELADILKLSTSRSLVLGDEVCSGTESYSATSLVAATLEHLEAKGAHFMFATHLHDLLKVPGLINLKGIRIWHLRVLQENGKLIYDRSLQPGSGSSSYGLEVAKAMGLPTDLMTRAYSIRRQLGGEAAADEAPRSLWNSAIQRKECENCGSAAVRDLEVHHIHERANGGGNHLRNLVVLCESCHDKHHAKEIDIQPLTQTSEGLERLPQVQKVQKVQKGLTEVEIDTIKATVTNLKGRPLQRIATELQEVHGIKITLQQLKKFQLA